MVIVDVGPVLSDGSIYVMAFWHRWRVFFSEEMGGGMHRSPPARLVDQNRPISSLELLQPVVVADNE